MAGDARIQVVGNLTHDPELRFTPSGVAVAGLLIATNPRRRQGDQWVDGDSAFYRCTVWRDHAEHVAESLKKGDRVVVMGELSPRSYETTEGEQRVSLDIDVDEIGPALRFATATAKRVRRGAQPAAEDPWESATPERPADADAATPLALAQ